MIKSKRGSTVYSSKMKTATYKLDSSHSWSYHGSSKNMGEKYKSTNTYVNESNHVVVKYYKHGLDIVDV